MMLVAVAVIMSLSYRVQSFTRCCGIGVESCFGELLLVPHFIHPELLRGFSFIMSVTVFCAYLL